MNDILRPDTSLITKINALMVKLRTLLLSAKLRNLTNLRSVVHNDTRWSSCYKMICRYQLLRGFLAELGSVQVDELSLTPTENRQFDLLKRRLEVLDSVTKALQKKNVAMGDVRALLDAVIDDFSDTYCRLTSNASIVDCLFFESAVIKVQRGNALALSREEKNSIAQLKLTTKEENQAGEDELSFVERVLKRQKSTSASSAAIFMDTRFLFPTSNVCERLFSKFGYALSDYKKGLTP